MSYSCLIGGGIDKSFFSVLFTDTATKFMMWGRAGGVAGCAVPVFGEIQILCPSMGCRNKLTGDTVIFCFFWWSTACLWEGNEWKLGVSNLFWWILICRAMGDVSDKIGRPTDNGQVCIVNTTIDGDII